jgi:hypothetical protein
MASSITSGAIMKRWILKWASPKGQRRKFICLSMQTELRRRRDEMNYQFSYESNQRKRLADIVHRWCDGTVNTTNIYN